MEAGIDVPAENVGAGPEVVDVGCGVHAGPFHAPDIDSRPVRVVTVLIHRVVNVKARTGPGPPIAAGLATLRVVRVAHPQTLARPRSWPDDE